MLVGDILTNLEAALEGFKVTCSICTNSHCKALIHLSNKTRSSFNWGTDLVSVLTMPPGLAGKDGATVLFEGGRII